MWYKMGFQEHDPNNIVYIGNQGTTKDSSLYESSSKMRL